jgi:hypothetical protein
MAMLGVGIDTKLLALYNQNPKENKGVCHTAGLPFTLKSILRQKKNYENSNISPCKNIFFKLIL